MEHMIKAKFSRASVLKYKQEADPVIVKTREVEDRKLLAQMKVKRYYRQ